MILDIILSILLIFLSIRIFCIEKEVSDTELYFWTMLDLLAMTMLILTIVIRNW